ncbi:peptide cleavage/export ABC transporter [Lactovum odontotermitis]
MKYKVIPQIGKEDCGAACVAMILENYFSRKASIYEIKPLIKSTPLGTSFYDLKRGIKKLGIQSKIFQAEKQKEVFDEMTYPSITQISTEAGIHFVVIFEKRHGSLIVGDSSGNKIHKSSIKKFMKDWIPYILEVDLSESRLTLEIEQEVRAISVPRILWLVKLPLIFSFLLSIIIYAAGIVIANLYTLYFNFLIPQKLIGLVFGLMVAYLIINLVNTILSFVNNFLYNFMCKKIDATIISAYFQGLLGKPNMAIESYDVGELLTNLSNILLIRQRFLTYLQMVPINVLTMGASFFLLFESDNWLASFVLIVVFVLGFIIYLSQERYQKLSKTLIKTTQEFNAMVINIFKNIRIIKQFSLENEFSERGIKKLSGYINTRTKLFNFDSVQNQLKTFVLSSFNIVLFSSGVYLIIKGSLSSGVLLTFNSILSYVTNPILNIANLQSTLVQGKVAQGKVYNILESKIKFFGDKDLDLTKKAVNISFENVAFDYDSKATVFENLSLEISGSSIAVAGANGSGKSTFGKMLSRLCIPDKGLIKINGIDLMDLSDKAITQNIIYVDGREGLFSSDVLDNIKLGREIGDAQIFETLDQLGAMSIFPNLDFENIDDTQLSLGQMQIIKILRSTLVKKKIYIFDEITNGLDSDLKSRIIKYLQGLEGMKIFITHDKDVTRLCEQEFVVQNKDITVRSLK